MRQRVSLYIYIYWSGAKKHFKIRTFRTRERVVCDSGRISWIRNNQIFIFAASLSWCDVVAWTVRVEYWHACSCWTVWSAGRSGILDIFDKFCNTKFHNFERLVFNDPPVLLLLHSILRQSATPFRRCFSLFEFQFAHFSANGQRSVDELCFKWFIGFVVWFLVHHTQTHTTEWW